MYLDERKKNTGELFYLRLGTLFTMLPGLFEFFADIVLSPTAIARRFKVRSVAQSLTCDEKESQMGAVSFSPLPKTQQEASVALSICIEEQWQYTLRERWWKESHTFMVPRGEPRGTGGGGAGPLPTDFFRWSRALPSLSLLRLAAAASPANSAATSRAATQRPISANNNNNIRYRGNSI